MMALVVAVGAVSGAPVIAQQQKADSPDEKVSAKEGKSDRNAKDIFYRPDPPAPAQPAPLALRYQILLRRGDYVSFVPERYEFLSGDQFRIIFQSNADGYAYILNRGTSGQGHVLFPHPQINGGQNRIPTHTDYIVPATGWYEFDALPGVEELFIFFSPRRIAQLDRASSSGMIEQRVWQQVVTTMIQTRSKDVKAGKIKDIVYVEEGQTVVPAPAPPQRPQTQPTPPPPPQRPQTRPTPPPPPQPMPNYSPATYVGSLRQQRAQLLIHTIRLRHN